MDGIILRNLFKDINVSLLSAPQKVLAFYRLVVELERIKEPDIKEYYEYPIHYLNDHTMLIDFPCNKHFCQLFENNRNSQETKFPLDLYIGLKMITGDKPYHLINMVIDFEDVKTIHIKKELLPVRISDFEINLKEAMRLELLPEIIDRINAGIKTKPTWQNIISILKKEISDDVSVEGNLYLALSSKSVELSQIYSELNSRRLTSELDRLGRKGSLIESFLMRDSINNIVDDVDDDSLLSVTQLDESQRKAVAYAMSSRISVITGAPGTGKTQVIENILANALTRGKKVLVVSRNNKAVDNVKDRFDEIDSSGYFLRFGSRRIVNTATIPSIDKSILEINQLADNDSIYEKYKQQYESAVNDILIGKKDLARIDRLKDDLVHLPSHKWELQNILNHIDPEHRCKVKSILESCTSSAQLIECSLEDLSGCLAIINKLYNSYSAKYDGLFGFVFRTFFVKKSACRILNEVENFPLPLKSYYLKSEYELCSDVSGFESYRILFEQMRKWGKIIQDGINFKQQLLDEDSRYHLLKSNVENKLEQLIDEERCKNAELNDLIKSLPSIQARIQNGKRWIQDNSVKLLTAIIHYNKKRDGSVRSITDYKNYLQGPIPWKNDEYYAFINSAEAFLNIFKLSSVTSLSVKNAFPLSSGLFDMVIVDEASQCDIASALPLIMRTKQLVVIGDPMQLRHITTVKPGEEQEIIKRLGIKNGQYVKYAESSLYDYCKDIISKVKSGQSVPYMLRCHYRSCPSIIGYSNNMFYGGIMGQRLEVMTDTKRLRAIPRGIVLVDVVGKQVSDNVNVNEAEARKSVELAVQSAQSYPDVSVGIVTPFRHQAERINSMIPSKYADRIEANTVHKYQGDEKDIMIYSLVVTFNSPNSKIHWIDDVVPNLVNVAVTRARSTLYVVGNMEYIKTHSEVGKPLGYLVRYNN